MSFRIFFCYAAYRIIIFGVIVIILIINCMTDYKFQVSDLKKAFFTKIELDSRIQETEISSQYEVCPGPHVREKSIHGDELYEAFEQWGTDGMVCLFGNDIRIDYQGERYWLVSFSLPVGHDVSAVYDSKVKKITSSVNYAFRFETKNRTFV
jgi:hypothetical protein